MDLLMCNSLCIRISMPVSLWPHFKFHCARRDKIQMNFSSGLLKGNNKKLVESLSENKNLLITESVCASVCVRQYEPE